MCGCSQLDKCTPHPTQDNTYSTSQTNLHLDENPMSRSKEKEYKFSLHPVSRTGKRNQI